MGLAKPAVSWDEVKSELTVTQNNNYAFMMKP